MQFSYPFIKRKKDETESSVSKVGQSTGNEEDGKSSNNIDGVERRGEGDIDNDVNNDPTETDDEDGGMGMLPVAGQKLFNQIHCQGV